MTPNPTTTPKPTPTPGKGTKPDNDKGGHVCAGRRFFTIRLRKDKGPFRGAKIWVNGKRVKAFRGKSGRVKARIDLRDYPRRTIKVRIVAVTTAGATLRGTRIYHPCHKKRPHTIPKL